MLWVILIIVLLIYIGLKIYDREYYWERKGIKCAKPWPLLGSFGSCLLRQCTFVQNIQTVYNIHPEAKFVGIYQLTLPSLMIKDPEMIKEVTVKSFDNFCDHTVVINEGVNALFGKNLFSLKGQKWRNMRATLSPAFTSSKMRKMHILIKECADQFTNYFIQKEKKEGTLQLEIKDALSKFTNDVIATCAFGITCNSLENDQNDIYKIGLQFKNFGFLKSMKFLGFIVIPSVMNALKIDLFDRRMMDFFYDTIKSTMEIREKNNIIRPDMIHLLTQARKGQLKHELEKDEDAGFATVEESQVGKENTNKDHYLSDDDIIAQAFLFFVAGYETTSSAMSFLAYELAVNPDIQKKLQDEIDAHLLQCNGDLDYDSLLKMKYLDMVVSECLRKWPPVPVSDRVCTIPITLVDGDITVTVERDTSIWIPNYALHHDPNYFSNPEIFDPERFNDENKHNIGPFTYMPFSVGPRNCIGSRFALLEIKTLFTSILSKFDIVVIDKTQVPLKLNKSLFVMKAEKGIWLGLKKRN